MHADVDDDPGRAHRLGVEHAELVARVLEVAEFVHQPLGVERPTLPMAGAPAQQSLPAVEQIGPDRGLRDLKVVTRHALVVDGRDLLPGRERVEALRHRPPHATRAGEVLTRPGVVDAPVGRRRDAALDTPYRLWNVEVGALQFTDRTVGQLLHPVAEGLLALDPAGGVGVERGDRLVNGSPGHDLVGDRSHIGLDPRELLETPRIGLLQVDRGPEEVPRLELIALAPDGLLVAAQRRQLLPQESRVVDRCPSRRLGGAVEVGRDRICQVPGPLDPPHQSRPEVVAIGGNPDVALLGDLEYLLARADMSVLGRLRERVARLGERGRHGGHPGGDVGGRLLTRGGHEIEDRPYGVQSAADDVDLTGDDASVVPLEGQPQPLLHGLLGYRLRLVSGGDQVKLGEGTPFEVRDGGVSLGREFGQPVIVAGDADLGGADRIQRRPLLDVAVGNLINLSHAADLNL